MARRTHYSYERRQREQAKTAKRAAKREARAAAKLGKDGSELPPEPDAEVDGEAAADAEGDQLPQLAAEVEPAASAAGA